MNPNTQFNIICLETAAFYRLVETVVEKLRNDDEKNDKWIDDKEAMHLLRITSKTTLQRYRDNGFLRFSQIGKKVILYDRESINEFIESKVKEPF